LRNSNEKVTKIIRQKISTRRIIEELKHYLGMTILKSHVENKDSWENDEGL